MVVYENSDLNGDADDDEKQISCCEAGQEHVCGTLHTTVAADSEDDEGVADHPQHERQAVHHLQEVTPTEQSQ